MKFGGAKEIPCVEVEVGVDEFENAIRNFGVEEACLYFGHPRGSEFCYQLIDELRKRAGV